MRSLLSTNAIACVDAKQTKPNDAACKFYVKKPIHKYTKCVFQMAVCTLALIITRAHLVIALSLSPPSAHHVFVGPHKHKLVAHKMIFVIDIWISNRETGYSNVPHKHTPRTISTLSAFTSLIHACAMHTVHVQCTHECKSEQ